MDSGHACKCCATPKRFIADAQQLANNDQDPGMKINTLMFALGKARLAFDREEGLC